MPLAGAPLTTSSMAPIAPWYCAGSVGSNPAGRCEASGAGTSWRQGTTTRTVSTPSACSWSSTALRSAVEPA